MSDHSVASTDHSHYSDCDWVPEYYPFALFSLGSPYWKPNSRKKGTLIIKGLLSNLELYHRVVYSQNPILFTEAPKLGEGYLMKEAILGSIRFVEGYRAPWTCEGF